ncbi:MAG: TerD family protein [Myxococcales bacterium]|nr:TerD family protein [Myxococcales bacterium]
MAQNDRPTTEPVTLARGQRTRLSQLGMVDAELAAATVEFQLVATSGHRAPLEWSLAGVDEGGALRGSDHIVSTGIARPTGAFAAASTAVREGNGARFRVTMATLPETVQRLVVGVAALGRPDLGDLAGLRALVIIRSTVSELRASFTVGVDALAELDGRRAATVVELYRSKGEWRIAAPLDGFQGGREALFVHYRLVGPAPALLPDRRAAKPAVLESTLAGSRTLDVGQRVGLPLIRAGSPRGIERLVITLEQRAKQRPAPAGRIPWPFEREPRSAPTASGIRLGALVLSGEQPAVVQALGSRFGAKDASPFATLETSDDGGETLILHAPEKLGLAAITLHAESDGVEFDDVDVTVVVRFGGDADVRDGELRVPLRERDPALPYCVAFTLDARPGGVDLSAVERYFRGPRAADAEYGFGFRWTT